MTHRPTRDTYFIAMAELVAQRATCSRRRVGCVLINYRGHVLATGYNGVPANFAHCIDHPCQGATQPSGQGLELCEAIHAEQNALLQCRDVHEIHTAYCTTAPCVTCVKLLLNTSCQRIIYEEDYPHAEQAKKFWERGGREWTQWV